MKRKLQKAVSVLLVFSMLCCVLAFTPIGAGAAETDETVAASTVKTRDEAVAWLRAQEGARYDIDGAYGSQCSDFTSAYVNYVLTGNYHCEDNKRQNGNVPSDGEGVCESGCRTV